MRIAPDKISTTFFFGEEGQTLQNAGTLILTIGEWQIFGATLLCGQDIVNQNYTRIRLEKEQPSNLLDDNNEPK